MNGLLDTLFGRRCSNRCASRCSCQYTSGIAPLPVFGEIVEETSVSHYMNVPMRIVTLGPSIGVCVAGASSNCGCGCGCGNRCGGCGSWGGCGGTWGGCGCW